MPRRSAISLFDRPSDNSCTTCFSRSVSSPAALGWLRRRRRRHEARRERGVHHRQAAAHGGERRVYARDRPRRAARRRARRPRGPARRAPGVGHDATTGADIARSSPSRASVLIAGRCRRPTARPRRGVAVDHVDIDRLATAGSTARRAAADRRSAARPGSGRWPRWIGSIGVAGHGFFRRTTWPRTVRPGSRPLIPAVRAGQAENLADFPSVRLADRRMFGVVGPAHAVFHGATRIRTLLRSPRSRPRARLGRRRGRPLGRSRTPRPRPRRHRHRLGPRPRHHLELSHSRPHDRRRRGGR